MAVKEEKDFSKADVATLRRLTTILNGGELTKQEFVKAFQQVIQIILTIEKRLVGDNGKRQSDAVAAFEQFKNDTSADSVNFKKSINDILNASLANINRSITQRFNSLQSQIDEYENGNELDKESMLKSIQASIPTVADLMSYLPTAGLDIRNALELLSGKERLNISAIDGVDELQNKILEAVKKGQAVQITGATRGFFVYIGGVKYGLLNTLNFVAGTGMTLVHTKVNGRDTITFNSSGGGGGFTKVAATGNRNGANLSFVFPNNTAQPSYIVSDGVWYTAVDDNSVTQWTWNALTWTATLISPPNNSLFGVV